MASTTFSKPVDTEIKALNNKMIPPIDGTINTAVKTLANGTTEYYDVVTSGWYSIRANNGNGSSVFRLYIGTENGTMLTSIQGSGAWTEYATAPIYIKAGTKIQTYANAGETRKLYRVG